MMKLFLIVLILFPTLTWAAPDGDTIVWGSRQLKWSDFKGRYDTASFNGNHFATTLWKLRYQYKTVNNKTQVYFIIVPWFDARHSWVKPSQKNNGSLLLHEQGHFDLAEVLARRFRKKLSETTFTKTNYADSSAAIFGQLLQEAYAQQGRYDMETDYGEKKTAQQKWQQEIAAELEKLSSFRKTDVYARIKF